MQQETIKGIFYTVCILSIIGSSLIIFTHIYKKKYYYFASNLIFYLSLGDLIFGVATILYIYPGQVPNETLCQVQGYLRLSSSVSTFFSSYFIAYCTHMNTVKYLDIQTKHKIIFTICCTILPLCMAMIPLLTNTYQTNIYVCGFDDNIDNQTISLTEQFILFYIPLWFATGNNIFLSIKVFLHLKYIEKSNEKEMGQKRLNTNQSMPIILFEKDELEYTKRITLSIILYPIILIICWFPFTVQKLTNFMDFSIVGLDGFRFIFPSLQGTLNAINYFFINRTSSKNISRIQNDYGSERSSVYSQDESY